MSEKRDVLFCLILLGEINLLVMAAVSFGAREAGNIFRQKARRRELEEQNTSQVRRGALSAGKQGRAPELRVHMRPFVGCKPGSQRQDIINKDGSANQR